MRPESDEERQQHIAAAKGLPGRGEINVFDSLDERVAVTHLLGRTLDQAEARYRDNLMGDAEDFYCMGPRAFCFYLDAAVAYLKSDAAEGDSDGVYGLLGAIRHRLIHDREAIAEALPRIRDLGLYLRGHQGRFDLTPEIYGDLPDRLDALCGALQRGGDPPAPRR